MALLISHNHTQATSYGLSFFKTAIKQIQQEKQTFIADIAVANRYAKHSEDEDFEAFIESLSDKKQDIQEEDEIISF